MYTDDCFTTIDVPVVVKDRNLRWNICDLFRVLHDAIMARGKRSLYENFDKIVTTLSGGLDSSFCLAVLRYSLGPDVEIHTFTIGGSEKHPDVISAKIVAEQFDTIHHTIIPEQGEIDEARNILETRTDLFDNDPVTDGDVAVFLLYQAIKKIGAKCVIAHDGMDELLGGYSEHVQSSSYPEVVKIYEYFWDRLSQKHLVPLRRKASYHGITPIFPYLDKRVPKFIAKIPVTERSHSCAPMSKIPLRILARLFLPPKITERKKRGFCDGLMTE